METYRPLPSSHLDLTNSPTGSVAWLGRLRRSPVSSPGCQVAVALLSLLLQLYTGATAPNDPDHSLMKIVLPTMERAGRAYIDAVILETQAGMATKNLPGQEALVICHGERCVLVRDYFLEEGRWWLAAPSLAHALDASLAMEGRQAVLTLPDSLAPPASNALGVGDLAPDLELPLLDGGRIRLSDLRGQRVLINSWASW